MADARDAGRPELVFALVAPAGVAVDDASKYLGRHLNSLFNYNTTEIKLSKLLTDRFIGAEKQPTSEYSEHARITHLQKTGNQFRKAFGRGDALAMAGIAAIREERAGITGDPDQPAPSHAYILHQLKHPKEVDLLRRVYGSSFILVAGNMIRSKRENALAKRIADKTDNPSNIKRCRRFAEEIIEADEKEDDDLGQNTRDTYPQADYFADFNFGSNAVEEEIKRFLELLFGHPFHTPYSEEHAMYHASAIALRSSDEGRQVGAVIANIRPDPLPELVNKDQPPRLKVRDLDIVASGMNEVPRAGGTSYMHPDSPDNRDQFHNHLLKRDHAKQIKASVLTELLKKIDEKKWFKETTRSLEERVHELLQTLNGTQFMDIGEFMRPVHAEMSALIDSARRGVPVDGLSMYVTSFPCHNCAKHIIAAGIRRVIYLEPYHKSRAHYLHEEEIDIEAINTVTGAKVAFLPFSGVAPRQYERLFSMAARGEKRGVSLSDWDAKKGTLPPRYVIRNAVAAYLLSERQELKSLPEDIYRWDKMALCPDRQ